jgi:hypothetical protein
MLPPFMASRVFKSIIIETAAGQGLIGEMPGQSHVDLVWKMVSWSFTSL